MRVARCSWYKLLCFLQKESLCKTILSRGNEKQEGHGAECECIGELHNSVKVGGILPIFCGVEAMPGSALAN